MEIRIFRAFSCNNSSSFRLVARFAEPKAAEDAAAELDAFFKEHAKQLGVAVVPRRDLAMVAVQGPNARDRTLALLPDAVIGRDGDDLLLRNFRGMECRYPDPDGKLGST